MSTRQYMIGVTMVLADRHGPYQFWRRDGAGWVQVECVYDPVHNLVCKFHEENHRRGNYDLATWGPTALNSDSREWIEVAGFEFNG
jgi:hypothetical protein